MLYIGVGFTAYSDPNNLLNYCYIQQSASGFHLQSDFPSYQLKSTLGGLKYVNPNEYLLLTFQ